MEFMRALTLAGLLLLCFAGVKNRNTTSAVSNHSRKPVDTIFLLKKRDKQSDQTVYIEKNRNSSVYKDLLDFKLDSNETEWYRQNCRDLYQNAVKGAKKYRLTGLPRQWVPVYKHAGNYYLYSPAEEGAQGRLMVTDTTVCFMYPDGYYPEQILSATNQGNMNWGLNVFSAVTGKHQIIVHPIDHKMHLAVWSSLNGGGNRYQLYVPKEYAYHFDMIVNRGDGRVKVPEFEFDKINYKTLLRYH
jgi:hypothetical protein